MFFRPRPSDGEPFNAVRRDRERALSVIAVLILVLWFLIAVVAILVTGGE
jgi:hypothetical protein